MAGFDYGRMQGTATRLLTRFKQGAVTLVRTTMDPGETPWTPGETVTEVYDLQATVRRVEEKYIDGTVIVGDEDQITFAVPPVAPNMSDAFTIEGRTTVLKDLRPIPASGTTVAYIAFVVGGGVPFALSLTPAALALDFANQVYTADGQTIAMPLIFKRNGFAYRTLPDGSVRSYISDEPRITPAGLYLEHQRTRFTSNPTNLVTWSIVSNATAVAMTAVGLFLPVAAGSSTGSTASMLSSNTNISLVAGQKVSVLGRHSASTSQRARYRVSTAAASSTVEGAVDDMEVVDEGAGTWSHVRTIDLGGGVFGFMAVFTAGSTRSDYRLRVGSNSTVIGQETTFFGAQLVAESDVGEWMLSSTAANAVQEAESASVDVSAIAPTGFALAFKAGATVDDITLHRVKNIDSSSSIVARLVAATGDVELVATVAGEQVGLVSPGATNPGQEYVLVVEWRDGLLKTLLNGGVLSEGALSAIPTDLVTSDLFAAGGSNLLVPYVGYYNQAM